ncbi:MAG: acyltransferase [Bacteroidota bacterium]|nr:acyltransferase [Flavisolibacter sp.]MBD0349562.1 acyltransferase [Flavisolibacter sp.]MBD0364623.1 acyltransferase [Flavisolibacter sp.]MBD0374047.1 acyltransferase [Flavisolibacter sp.]MDQ3846113.1 acyltransferase [Bacteroidota bacterium]
MNIANKPDLPPLTGVRFMAAFFVFIFHYNPFPKNTFIWGICNEMYSGVSIFFVLSGFLICYNYFDSSSLRLSFVKSYFIKRFARIYPVYFVLTNIFYLYNYFLHDKKVQLPEYFLNITLLKGLSGEYMFSGLFQAWSLTVEECFYAFAPLIFLLYRRKKILFIQAAFFVLVGILLVLFFRHYPFWGFFSGFQFMFLATFFGRCFEFFVGIFLAFLLKRYSYIRIPFSKPVFTFAGLIFIFFGLIIMSAIRYNYHVEHASEYPVGLFFHNVLFPVGVAVFFFGLVRERSILSRIFSSSVFQWLGKSSYIFYLIHAGLFANVLTHLTGERVVLKFIVLQGMAITGYWFFEKPVNKKIRNFFLVRKEKQLHASSLTV